MLLTAINYCIIADLHNLQSLHINLFTQSVLVLTDLSHKNYKSLTELCSQYHCATAHIISVVLSPLANYTDRAIAAGQRS
jgi:hypothetical protein